MLNGFGADLRLALRSFRAAPAVTGAALLTLTLGLGATTAIFSVANALMLRPLPVSNPHRLVTVTSETALRHGFQAGAGWNYAMWEKLRQRADAFGGASAWTLQRFDLSEGGEMQPATGLVASGNFFETLGVRAVIGRTFTPADDDPGGGADGPVAVISHSLWRRRFGSRPDVAGFRLLLDRVPVTVVGVAPAWFSGIDVGQPFDVAIPFGTDAVVRGGRSVVNSERSLLLTVMLRLGPDQGISEGTAALRTLQPDIVGPGAPAFLKDPFVLVHASTGISDRSRLRQNYQYPLVTLSIVSGIVLVIVCLNIANLLLSQASARRSELSVRLALGAPAWRLARQPLVEALTLATAGAAAAVLFAAWASRAVVALLPFAAGRLSLDLRLDWRVFGFTAAVAIIAATLCGVLPALYVTRVSPMEALRHVGRPGGARSVGRWSNGLVIVQIALSIVLLAGAGLFAGTINRLSTVPLGFDPRGLVVVTVNPPRAVPGSSQLAQLHGRLLEAVAAVPGVRHVAGSIWTPVGTGGGGLITDARGRRADARQVAFNFVTPGWFATYATSVTMGREFDTRDGPGAPQVALVNDSLRRSLFSDSECLGTTIHAGPCSDAGCTIVGVVADAVYGHSLRDGAPPTVYMPLGQAGSLAPPNAPFRISVRTAGDRSHVMAAVGARLREVDSGVTFTFRRVEQDVEASIAQERLLAILAGFFGVVALLLSGVGLYGVSAQAASRRRAEIGVRLALGGSPHVIVRTILTRLALCVLVSAVLGVLGSLWLAHFVAPLLYGVEAQDPASLAGSTISLVLVAAIAGWVPAWRATRIDPAQLLREV